MKRTKIKILCSILALSLVIGVSAGCAKGKSPSSNKPAASENKEPGDKDASKEKDKTEDKKENTSNSSKEQTSSKKLDKTIKSKDNLVQLNVSSEWSTQTNLNDAANIQVANLPLEKYLINISDSKENFSNSFTVKDYYEAVSRNMEGMLNNGKVEAHEELTIGGNKAIQFEVKGEMDKLKVAYLVTIIETKGYFHQVISWTLIDRFEKYKVEYKDITNTFKEI
ncbi:hypothetical protein [Clostridium polynesiense]|uniref:hypothetical protein n=1 Tax=Clostridium polynesiense TaxID=1325933 RepID=UPI00058DD68A|nr:hypothetical protein [Clostridium polynesiense]